MLANPPAHASTVGSGALEDRIAIYSKSVHDYTLKQWTQSRREAEEKAQARAKKQKTPAPGGADRK